MGGNKRLFVGLPLTKDVAAPLTRAVEAMSGGFVRWIPPENWHITVEFFGEIEADRVPALTSALMEALRGLASFSLTFEKLTFGPPAKGVPLGTVPKGTPLMDSSTMIWVLFKNEPAFTKLVRAVRTVADRFVRVSNRKTIIPHVTIARFETLPKDVVLVQPSRVPPLRVDSCALYESELQTDSALYTRLANFPFPT